jgi:hypothetical protein
VPKYAVKGKHSTYEYAAECPIWGRTRAERIAARRATREKADADAEAR